MSLTPQFLDEIRTRTTLSALIGRSVKLVRAGREFRACCPFHNEKSPSFYVNDEKGFYHCFGCGAHGDAIRFLTEAQGLPFIDAVKELAQNAGMDMPAPDPRAAEKAERQAGLHDVMAAAANWFTEQLNGIAGAEARAYLDRRGVPDELRRAFGLGFAPDSRGKLKSALREMGEGLLIEGGMLIQVEGKDSYDRFRGRLMIPIRDPRGRVIAFGGRIIGDGEPKYLNSPETPLFDKGRTLYNLDRAGPASRKANRVLVVEGYMDAIALARAGINEVVAPLGTALTESQIERLWRLVDAPLLCFDGDAAGQKAAVRAALRALPMAEPGRTLRFALMPAGQDPDDLVKAGGPAAMEAVLAQAISLDELIWRHEQAAEPLSTPEARAGLRRRLADHAATIADRDVREQYQAEFRARFDTLFERKQPAFSRAPFIPGQRPPNRGKTPWRQEIAPASSMARSISSTGMDAMMRRALLAGLIRHPDLIAAHAEDLGRIAFDEASLIRTRSVLIDAAFDSTVLEKAQCEAILIKAGLGDVVEELHGTNALAFSFLRGNADSERARRDLAAVITMLAARPGLDAALAAATERLKLPSDDDVFAEQVRLRSARDALDQSLAALAQGDDDSAL